MATDTLTDEIDVKPVSFRERATNLKLRQDKKLLEVQKAKGAMEIKKKADEADAVGIFEATAEHDDSFWDNTLEVVGTAIETAEEQVVRSIGDFGDSFNAHVLDVGTIIAGEKEFMGDVGVPIPFTDVKVGYVNSPTYLNMKELYEISTGEKAATLSNFELADVDRPDSAAGQFGADMLKWVAVFAATRKTIIKGPGGQIAKGAAAGAITDFAAFDPHEARLSDLLQSYGKGNPVFDNAVTEYLASDKDDDALEGRLKNSMEGLIVGGAIDGLFKAIKWLRQRRIDKSLNDFKPESTELKPTKEVVEPEVKPEAEAPAKAEEAPAKVEEPEVKPGEADKVKQQEELDELVQEPKYKEVVSAELQFKNGLSEDAVAQLAKHIQDGDLSKATEMVNFNEAKIDWDTMEDPESLKQLFYAFEDAMKPMIDEATGGVVTHKTTKALAEEIGYTAKNAEQLFGTLKEHKGLSTRMFAAHQAMVASGRHLRTLAETAKGGNSDAVFKLHRHVELHAALMAQVKGSQTEIARSLSAMRMMKDAMADSFHQFEDITSTLSKHGKKSDAMADLLLSTKDMKNLNKNVAKISKRGPMEWIQEVAINGLLSSPKTHVVNITSNIGMTVLGPIERYVSAAIGLTGKSAARVTFREANAATLAQFSALGDALNLAYKAAKEGKPQGDMRQRVEFDARRAIQMEGDGFIAGAVNLLGDVIRLPGRALLAGDEFFKTIAGRSESTAQAYRVAAATADAKGLKGKKSIDFIKKETARLIDEPTHVMEQEAIAYQRRQTFQESATSKFGRDAGTFLNSHPLIKLTIAPFFRTPMNLLRQAFVDRTPLAYFNETLRAELMNGGPKAQIAQARIVTGMAIYTSGYNLAANGVLTGKGENYGNSEKLDKIPEYSFKIGDRHVQYNRLDPLGSMLGLMADTQYAVELSYDPMDPDSEVDIGLAVSGTMGALMTNSLNKTWMQSLQGFMEMTEAVSTGSQAARDRAFQKYLGDETIKYIPFGSAVRSYTQSTDPVVREAWTIIDRVSRVIPGISTDLPPMRDALGRPITRENAGLYWLNPFGVNPESDNPVDTELAKLKFDTSIIQKNINGVPIDSTQYSRLKELMGDFGQGPTAEEQIAQIIKTPMWKAETVTDAVRIQLIKNLMRSRKAIAKQILLAEDEELRNQVLGLKVDKASLLSGEDLSRIKDDLGLE